MLCLLLLLNELSFEGDFHSSEKKMYRKKVKGEITTHFPSRCFEPLCNYIVVIRYKILKIAIVLIVTNKVT